MRMLRGRSRTGAPGQGQARPDPPAPPAPPQHLDSASAPAPTHLQALGERAEEHQRHEPAQPPHAGRPPPAPLRRGGGRGGAAAAVLALRRLPSPAPARCAPLAAAAAAASRGGGGGAVAAATATPSRPEGRPSRPPREAPPRAAPARPRGLSAQAAPLPDRTEGCSPILPPPRAATTAMPLLRCRGPLPRRKCIEPSGK